ncbi:hypothetical protein BZL30_4171 [Mycobacterium kansasii]|uniref:Uncharacterized protein n=1 Tax=Mycobacterium kansasii TaxID=1768 RepID=A0A1V3X8Q8_MYCKA|nr:hypothetical protein BZL30_4171 [Mycobacterium kansasii]
MADTGRPGGAAPGAGAARVVGVFDFDHQVYALITRDGKTGRRTVNCH